MSKHYNATRQGQVDLCYQASHQAAKDGLAKMIESLYKTRHGMMAAWRENKTDEAWSEIEKHDELIDRQEQILMTM